MPHLCRRKTLTFSATWWTFYLENAVVLNLDNILFQPLQPFFQWMSIWARTNLCLPHKCLSSIRKVTASTMHAFLHTKGTNLPFFLRLSCIYILWPKFTRFCGGVDIMTHISTYPSSHMNKNLHGRPLLNQNVESVQSVYWESRDAIFNSCAPFFSISLSLFPLVARQTHSNEERRRSS